MHALREPTAAPKADWQKFRSRIRGRVILPDDPSFDRARRVYNGAIDRRPALIVRCAGAADMIMSIAAARERNLPLAVRGGGHSLHGFGVCDGGLVVDLGDLRGIDIDTTRSIATVQAGATCGDLDHETQAFGLATTTAHISSVGIGGMALGGGCGWLMRRHGLAIDNLLSADVVTADGRFITASEDEHADLFWALRGGGGNFGIVTSFRFRLHRLDAPIIGGTFFYPASRSLDLLPCFRDTMRTASDNFSALFGVLIAPAAPFLPGDLQNTPVVAITVCHLGSPADADADFAPFRRLRPLVDRVAPMPYRRLQRLFDAAGEFGRNASSRAGHLADFSDAAIRTFAQHACRIPAAGSIAMLSVLGGAVGRVDELKTSFGYRRTSFDFAANSRWNDDRDTARHTAWTSEFGRAMQPFVNGCYVNEAAESTLDEVPAYPPQTYRRLASVKAAYDPNNFFRMNYNITPEANLTS
jgi:FAD/FMN-containing dehydrogenase